MKKKISKLLSLIIFPVVAFLTLGVFVANSFVSGSVDAFSNGGAFIAGQYTQITIGSKTTISGFFANLGGGACVSKGEVLSTSGSIFRNNAVNGGGILVAKMIV